jgi:GDP-D-mannose dehydratase
MAKKRALITGVTGQDGSYLAEFLLAQGYEVAGMVRRTSTINFERIIDIQDKIKIVQGDLLDPSSLVDILREHRPSEVYNLAAQSFVPTSWKQPVLTGEFTALGVTRIVQSLRRLRHFVQPRIGAARLGIFDAQSDVSRRQDRARARGQIATGQPGLETRLGLGAGLRACDVADAAAGPAG